MVDDQQSAAKAWGNNPASESNEDLYPQAKEPPVETATKAAPASYAARIMVIIPFRDRKRVAELCVPTIAETLTAADYFVACNDGSTEYGAEFLTKLGADRVFTAQTPHGIEAQRRTHLAYYWSYQHAYSHLYFTDPDALHDPEWRSYALDLQAKAGGAPVCLYNTATHVRMVGNTIEEDIPKGIVWRRVAPGISYLLTREHVGRIMTALHALNNFDWMIPALLGGRFAVSRKSYVDHIGWGGMHHPLTEGPEGGDVGLNCTDWLVKKRSEVVECLR